MINKKVVLNSIAYVRRLLDRFEKAINGGHDSFNNLELNDLTDILGFEYEELKELIK